MLQTGPSEATAAVAAEWDTPSYRATRLGLGMQAQDKGVVGLVLSIASVRPAASG